MSGEQPKTGTEGSQEGTQAAGAGAGTGATERVHKVEVGRTPVERELAGEITKAELAKQKLIDDLDAANAKITELEGAQSTKTTEYDALVKERDDYREQVTAIALEKFQKEKVELLESLKAAGLNEEKLKEIDDKMTGPNEYEQMKWTFAYLQEQLETGAAAAAAAATAEEEKAMAHFKLSAEEWGALTEEAKKAKIAEMPAEGAATVVEPEKGTKPTDPPRGSVVQLEAPKVTGPREYASYREMIDDLYDRANAGDKVAERQLKQLWDKLPGTIKELSPAFTIVECPRCKNGVVKGEVCPYCDWDPSDFQRRGGEI